jgi:hypothetical protein
VPQIRQLGSSPAGAAIAPASVYSGAAPFTATDESSQPITVNPTTRVSILNFGNGIALALIYFNISKGTAWNPGLDGFNWSAQFADPLLVRCTAGLTRSPAATGKFLTASLNYGYFFVSPQPSALDFNFAVDTPLNPNATFEAQCFFNYV